MQKRKNFIYVNEEFICENCGAKNPVCKPEIRNHCRECLYCKHLDLEVPGDRLAECGGLMKPVKVYSHKKKGFMIEFECLKCAYVSVNKVASDDNPELLGKLSAN